MQDHLFIIRTTKYMERDLIAQTFSAEFGKKSYLIRGGQRSKKRFGGGLLETGNLLVVEFKNGKSASSLDTLLEAKIINGYEAIRLDYDKLQLLFNLFKLISSIEWTELEFGKVFSLLNNTLLTIEQEDTLERIKFIFLIKILYLQGVLPINEITKKWLQLNIKDSAGVTIDAEYNNYKKICDHLLKELINKDL